MGLFDFLRKKQHSEKTENELEGLLRKAATDPSVRADFYNKLLSEDLFVISEKSGAPEGLRTVTENTSVRIFVFSDGKMPVFTSTDRIFDKGVIKEQVSYLAMKGKALFEMTKGATYLLNPYSDYGKELLANEIESLLAGTIFRSMTRQMTVEKDTTLFVGQPAKYPAEMIDVLIKVYAEEATVKAAYLAWVKFKDTDDPPHYAILVDAERDISGINTRAGKTAQQYLGSGEFVDFLTKDSLGDYCDSIEPFYKRDS